MAKLGVYEENPARQDVEEIGRMIGIDFAVNAILSPEKADYQGIGGRSAGLSCNEAFPKFGRSVKCRLPRPLT